MKTTINYCRAMQLLCLLMLGAAVSVYTTNPKCMWYMGSLAIIVMLYMQWYKHLTRQHHKAMRQEYWNKVFNQN